MAKKAAEAAEKDKKETGDKTATEVAGKPAEKDVVFKANPQLDVYYKTSDGLPFFTKNKAELHAAGLKDKTVEKITKKDVE